MFEIVVSAIAGNTGGLPITGHGSLLRIFFGENDRFGKKPLYEAIVLKPAALAGATVLRGPMGFGHSSKLHTTKVLRLSFDLPIVVEIVDTEAKLNEFLPTRATMASGLVTLEKVQVLQYGVERLRQRAV